MQKLVNFLLSILISLLSAISAQAQFENSDIIINNGGIITSYPQFFNKATGKYTGSNAGIFEHVGVGIGTFVNDGVYEGTSGHQDIFNGVNDDLIPQDIGGLVRPRFYNLTLSNGPTGIINVTNAEGISVTNQLKFENGITNTTTSAAARGSIRLEAGSSFIGGESDDQHVNGYVTKKGNTAFKFPVGTNSDIRTLEISAPGNVNAEVSVAWLSGDPSVIEDPSDPEKFHPVTSVKGQIRAVHKSGQWDWIPVVQPENPLALKASIPNVFDFSTPSELRLVGWDGTGWIDLSNDPSATGTNEDSFLSGTIPIGVTISAIGIGSVSPPLPVTLVSFRAFPHDDHFVNVIWSTSLEVDNSHFEIEHSTDARVFELLGKVDAIKNQIAGKRNYSFLDNIHTRWGRHYYRLKMVDMDGTYSYSKIQTVELSDIGLVVSPNPASEKLTVTVGGEAKASLIEIYNQRGVKVYSAKAGGKINDINVVAFPTGSYILTVSYLGRAKETTTFVLVH